MGKKSQKRSSRVSSSDDPNDVSDKTAAAVKSSRRTKDRSSSRKTLKQSTNSNIEASNSSTQLSTHQQSISMSSVSPVKILNPFYIESSSNQYDQQQDHDYDDINQEQFGLLECEDYRNDIDGDADQPYAYTTSQKQQQQIQRMKQLQFEWNIRVCLTFSVTILITWLLLSILNSSGGQTVTKEQNDTYILPSTATKELIHPPTTTTHTDGRIPTTSMYRHPSLTPSTATITPTIVTPHPSPSPSNVTVPPPIPTSTVMSEDPSSRPSQQPTRN